MAAVRVEGLNKLVRDLQRLGVETDDIKEAWQPLGRDIVNDAKRIVPVGPGTKKRPGGTLRNSIRTSNRKNGIIISAGGAKAFYAWFVYRGSIHNSPPVPFIKMAMAGIDIDGEVQRALARIINRVL